MTCGTATLNTSFTEGEKEILLPVEESTTLESDDSGGSGGSEADANCVEPWQCMVRVAYVHSIPVHI